MSGGAITALATPYAGDGLHERRFAALAARQMAEGVDGLVPCGTTGEGSALTDDERERRVRLCAETARVPVRGAA